MTWFIFVQNNSGGYYIEDEIVDHLVLIEETTARKAEKKARSIISRAHREFCNCCGERWDFDDAYEYAAETIPSFLYSPAIAYHKDGSKEFINTGNDYNWRKTWDMLREIRIKRQ